MTAQTRDWRDILFATAFAAALIFGGGGAEGPAANGFIAFGGAILLGTILADHATRVRPLPAAALILVSTLLAVLLLAVIQVLPIPSDIWTELPGREIAAAAFEAIGEKASAHSYSIDAVSTVTWTTALLMPAAIALHLSRAPSSASLFITVLLSVATLSGVIGALQLAMDYPELVTFYDGPSPGAASGIFANPNHQGLFMVIAMITAAASGHPSKPRKENSAGLLRWVGVAFFALMAVASGSRAVFLLLLAFVPAAILLGLQIRTVPKLLGAATGAVVLGVLIVLLYPGTNALALRESFGFQDDLRAAYLPDVLTTIRQFWPMGSGLGTFTLAFPPNENLDVAGAGFFNHAHNDYLELMIEGGAPAIIILMLLFIALVTRFLWTLANDKQTKRESIAAMLILVAVALHSIGDYPIRSATLAAVCAFAVGLICSKQINSDPRSSTRSGLSLLIGLLITAPIGFQALRLNLLDAALRDGDVGYAAMRGPENGAVLARLASNLLEQGAPEKAEVMARRAVALSPLAPLALSTFAAAKEARGADATTEWQIASRLGWRDQATQAWAFAYALKAGQADVAALRADAILRTGQATPEFLATLRALTVEPRFRRSLIARMKANPPWLRSYFAVTSKATDSELGGVVNVVGEMAQTDRALASAQAAPLAAALIAAKRYRAAESLYFLLDPSQDRSRESPPFPKEAEDRKPSESLFVWRVLPTRTASVAFTEETPVVLVIKSSGQRQERIADVHFPLPAGSYNLSYRYLSNADGAVRAQLRCLDDLSELARFDTAATNRAVQGAIPVRLDRPCPIARLDLETQVIDREAETRVEEVSVKAN